MKLKVYKITKIITRHSQGGASTGLLIPLWKDYEAGKKIRPRYIYFMSCAPKSFKGPYLHTKRRGFLTLIEGRLLLVYKDGTRFKKIFLNADRQAMMVDMPKNTAYLMENPFKKEAQLINICDYPWKKGDHETVEPDFSKYFSAA